MEGMKNPSSVSYSGQPEILRIRGKEYEKGYS